MKNLLKSVLAVCIMTALCLGISACAVDAPPAPPAPSAAAVTAPAETEIDPVEPVPQQSAGPETELMDESEEDSDIAAGCEVLENIYESYYPGTAGSSLRAAKYAAMLLDWFVSIGSKDAPGRISIVHRTGESFAASHDLRAEAETENGVPVNFPEKLGAIWSSAVSLAFGDTMVLDDAGYESLCLWNASDADDLFTALYEGLGLERSGYLTVYYPDDQVMYLLHTDIPSYMDDASGILFALQTAKAIPREVEILSCEMDPDGVLKLDLNDSFREYICRMGTSGEALTIAALVDTFLSATGARSLRLTVEGRDLETGHAIYDSPLNFEDSFSG